MNTAAEPIFAAHQIKVPSEFPEILKNYSKFIIRTQPDDIIEASAKYFSELINTPVKVKADPKEHLYSFYKKCTEQSEEVVTKAFIEILCSELNVESSIISDIFSLLEVQASVKWLHFWTFLIANLSHSVEDTLKTAFSAMCINGTAPSAEFIEIVKLLTDKDKDSGLPANHIITEITGAGERFSLELLSKAIKFVPVE